MPKFTIPVFGKAKIYNSNVWKAKIQNSDVLRKANFRIQMIRKSQSLEF